jgi:hypothetical protein
MMATGKHEVHAMDERALLKAQITMLEQELGWAKAALKMPQIDDALRSRVTALFEEQFTQQLQDLNALSGLVEDNQPLDACWSSFKATRRACEPLFEECLALIAGALVRSNGADNGLCQVADALLDDLSRRLDIPWGRFTILAEKEFFGEMAQVIRLRFPEVSIWNLPVAAHEFGHFVGPELKKPAAAGTYTYPFQDELIGATQQGNQNWFHLHEHFADLFATYALGIAFAGTCILLRFNPLNAFTDTEQHPCHAKRLYVIHRALQKMNLKAYKGFIDYLEEIWQRNLKAAGSREQLEPQEILQLDVLLDRLYEIAGSKLALIQYKDFVRAYSLSNALLTDGELAHIVKPEHSLTDALNAAWLYRIEHEVEDNDLLSEIETRVIKICHEILRQRGKDGMH